MKIIKCSFLDKERLCKHVKYKGKRIKRGLFKTGSGRIINADVNGSYNIMKKNNSKLFKNKWNTGCCSASNKSKIL
jgi:putative transposase